MKNLKTLRKSCNLSQKELSQFLHISQQSICKYENGYAEANETLLIRTANFFGTSVDYLLGLCDSPKTTDFIQTPVRFSCQNSLKENFLLNLYRNAPQEQRQAVDTILKSCSRKTR